MNEPIKIVDSDGTTRYTLKGKHHRTDGPAIEFANGDKFWYLNGEHHRTDGPAIEFANGDKYWYLNGEHHRTDGPAIEFANGDKFWLVNNKQITLENHHSFINDYPDLVNQFLAHEAINKLGLLQTQ